MDYIRNFDAQFASTEKSTICLKPDYIRGLNSYKEQCKHDKEFKQTFRKELAENIVKFSFVKALLLKQGNPTQVHAKTETYVNLLLGRLLEIAEKNRKM